MYTKKRNFDEEMRADTMAVRFKKPMKKKKSLTLDDLALMVGKGFNDV